jgi:hypothetical protein
MSSGGSDRYSAGHKLTSFGDEHRRQARCATKTVYAAKCHMLSQCSFPRVVEYIYLVII